MNYILITVIEREILTEQFKTFDEAHNTMMEEFCKYSRINPNNCTEEESDCDGKFGYCKWNAYISDGPNHDNYDWLIVELIKEDN